VYAIVDLETTGSRPGHDRIIEIGIVIHNGAEIVQSYSSLVNPECGLNPFISKLTGITPEMLYDAPKFYEIAADIVKFTEDCVFVAHNVHFDYAFLKAEFKNLGYNFQKKALCTVKMSRKLIPGFQSYSLGRLARSLNITIPDGMRHRALGDATATAQIFHLLITEKRHAVEGWAMEEEMKTVHYPPLLNKSVVENLPSTAGVYYFHNQAGDVIYVGMSKNIHTRILQHFQVNPKLKKIVNFKTDIADITYEETGNELVALLYECYLIKKLQPKYNIANKRTQFIYGLYYQVNEGGYITFSIKKATNHDNLVVKLSQQSNDKGYLETLLVRYQLCQSLLGLYNGKGPCLHYTLNMCKGACCGKEGPDDYNERAMKVITDNTYVHPNFFVLGMGRKSGEKSVIWVEEGTYRGFGFFDEEYAEQSMDFLKSAITKYPDNRDVQSLLRGNMRKVLPKNIIAYHIDK